MKLNIVMLGMLLLLSVTTLFAAGTSQQVENQLWVRNNDNAINVSLLVFNSGQPSTAVSDLQAQYDSIAAACKGSQDFNTCITDKSAALASNAQYPVSFHSVEKANFTFLYWNPFRQGGAGWVPVPGCEKVTADQQSTMINITGGQIQLWTGTCVVDKNIYSGRTISVRVASAAGDSISAPVQSVTLSDANASAAAMFTSALTNALAPIQTSLAIQGQGQTVPCLGVFIILGLLLASMYFSGKSPITMLDITTPRLPSPKGLQAGGQIIAPFGYGEMKKTVNAKLAAGAGLASAEFAASRGRLSQSTVNEINKLAGRVKDAREAAIFKGIAAKHVETGGKISDLKRLAKPFSEYTREDNASLRQTLGRLERMGGRTALLAKGAIDARQSQDLMANLTVLTHKPNTKVGAFVQNKVLGRVFGSSNLSFTGQLATGSYAASLRSVDILAKGTKASVLHGAEFVRETGRLAVQTVGGKNAMNVLRERAKTSTSYATLYKELTKAPARIEIGKIMPVNMKMGQLFTELHSEVQRDQMRYLLKQIYKRLGVNVAAMTDREMFAMTERVVDPLKITGYAHSGRMASAESEIHAILSSGSLSIVQKRERLETLLTTMGGHIDTSYLTMKAQVDRIGNDPAEGHVKLIMLQEMLNRENSASKGAREGEARLDDKYYCLVGRPSLHGSDLYEVALLRKMITELEGGRVAKGVSINDFMNALRVEMENKIMTLNPGAVRADLLPEYMQDAGMRQRKTEENRKLLASLITEEGEKVLRELTGKNKSNATIKDFESVLYGSEYMIRSQGLQPSKTLRGKDDQSGVIHDPRTGKALWLEDGSAIGPQAGWWKTDMKQQWLCLDNKAGMDTRNLQLTVATAIQAKAERSYQSLASMNNALAAELERYPGAKTWSLEKRTMELKKAWVNDLLSKDMHNTFNDRFAMNAYGNTTNETSRFQLNAAAALLAKALRDAGFEERHADLRFLEHMDVNSPKDMQRFRELIGTRYKNEFAEVLKKGVTFDDMAHGNTAWIMTHEGTYIPYRSGMPVSDNDRVIGGKPAIHDGKVWRSFSPEDVRVEFRGRDDLGMAFNKVAGSHRKEDWEPVINAMMEWARPNGKGGDYEKERVVGAVLWRYSNATYDYQSYWNKSAVKLVPRHEATPLAPSMLRYFGSEAPGLTKTLKPLHDFGQLVGTWMTRTALTGTGDLYLGSYDVTPKSQLLKMYSWRLTTQIMNSDMEDLLKDVSSLEDRNRLAAAYRAMAMAHGAFHQVWAYTIDRHPGRASTSHGAAQAWSAAFQYGPAMTYSMKANLGAYMSKGEYMSFMLQGGWAAALSRHAIMPYQKLVAGPQRSLQGYASSHDWNPQDALRAYGDHTPPRLLESLRGYNPFSFSHGPSNSRFSQLLQKANWFESRAEKAQLVGYDHQKGLSQGYAAIQTVYKGAANIARTGLANPGASYMDTKFNEQIAPAMAEYAMMSMGPMSGFYESDEYVRRMGMTDTIRRTVSAEALAIKRQQELMGFGVFQNQLYTWFNPLLFAYHMGVPGYPTSMSPKELIGNFINKWKRGGSSGNLEQSLRSAMRSTADGMARAFSPQMASLQKFCSCGKPGMRGCACMKCGNLL
jgi:hypothetical protein